MFSIFLFVKYLQNMKDIKSWFIIMKIIENDIEIQNYISEYKISIGSILLSQKQNHSTL